MTKIDAIFFNSLTDSHPKFQPAGWQAFRGLTLRCGDPETSSG